MNSMLTAFFCYIFVCRFVCDDVNNTFDVMDRIHRRFVGDGHVQTPRQWCHSAYRHCHTLTIINSKWTVLRCIDLLVGWTTRLLCRTYYVTSGSATMHTSKRNIVSNKTECCFVPIYIFKHYPQLHAIEIEIFIDNN